MDKIEKLLKDFQLSKSEILVSRTCSTCSQSYTINEHLDQSSIYFPKPYDYIDGCRESCLACWLGVGPNDQNEFSSDELNYFEDINWSDESSARTFVDEAELAHWTSPEIEEALDEGDILKCFEWYVNSADSTLNLVAMPIDRLIIDWPIVFPGAIVFFPSGGADLDQLNVIENSAKAKSHAEQVSALSGIDLYILNNHPLVFFPCKFEWESVIKSSHKAHLDFIRTMSEMIDSKCLNLARYRLCDDHLMDNLPARAGQVASNHMMAGALLYNCSRGEGRIIGGAAFTHYIIRGLGLNLERIEWDKFPRYAETGQLVNHALSLYTAILESSNPTSKFVQALSLLEFLACPDDYMKFEEVKKIIARYIARDAADYQRILDRFHELTGKKDPVTKKNIGYRTRIVHMGERIEQIVPDPKIRQQLFFELDGYIRPVIDHMIAHSQLTYADYQTVRDNLRPFEVPARK